MQNNDKQNINLVKRAKVIDVRVIFSAPPAKLIKKSIGASVLHCHCYRQ